jgi:hypothetical protein
MLNYRQHLAVGVFTAALLAMPLAVHAQDGPSNSNDGQSGQIELQSNQHDAVLIAATGQNDDGDKAQHSPDE